MLENHQKNTKGSDDIGSFCNFGIDNVAKALNIGHIETLSLETLDGERGIFTKRDIKQDSAILRVPLSSCIRDDAPPLWYLKNHEDDDGHHSYNPSEWATRIAASLIDLELTSISEDDIQPDEILHAKKQWLAMMPDPTSLRQTLPIHWSEEAISKAKCTALEISIDSSYFSRAAAITELSGRLQSIRNIKKYLEEEKLIDIETLCNNALDLVQTRSCRVERIDGIQLCPPLRVIAPIFDFINHGSSQYYGDGCANAFFGLEGEGSQQALVVRAKRDIAGGQQVLIDYGDSARPAWRCLTSYGFVPKYRILKSDDNGCDGVDECVAEVFYNGCRYEVSPHTIPTELVEAAHVAFLEDEEGARAFEVGNFNAEEFNAVLLPEVALRLAKRISDAAFDLVIEHPEDHTGGNKMLQAESVPHELAKALRWSQHQVLLACALGLRDYAARQNE
jgi:hypothetical protein